MFKNCRKEDLRIVALELGETVAEKVTIVELTEIIKENKYFKEDVELVKELIHYTIEDRMKAEEDRKRVEEDRKRVEEDRKKEAENRLREKELELELARLNVRVNSDNERTGEGCNSLDALVKSVRILTVKVPNRPEGWAFFFASLERAFVSKNVSEKFNSLEKEVASHISVQAGNDWFRPLELAKEIDLYNTSRGKSLKPLPNVLTRNNPVKNASRVFLSEIKDSKCICCAKSHPLYKCAVYLKLPINKRIDLIKTNNLCFNCLSTSHRAKDCKSRFVCSECQKRHHKTIHYTERAENQEVRNSTFEPLNTSVPVFEPQVETQNNLLTATSINRKKSVLLSSAICYIESGNGLFPVKAILDSGSTSNLLTKSLCDLIGLKKYKTNVSVSGLNNSVIPTDSCVSVSISNKEGSYIKTLDFFLVPKITKDLVPTTKIDFDMNKIPNLKLADKNFNIPEHVQMLLGAEVFYELMLPGQFKMEGSNVIFQNTVFGFVISGSTSSDAKGKEHCGFIQAADNLEHSIKKFWEIENVEIDSVKTSELDICEDHFKNTHSRDDQGRYTVAMPLKPRFRD
ncbi:integrase catalytic domain-containing protein [Trichonephila clavipes]|uniref:Integrase catalytic domain-containing protein n=1 Tax=Trichonephila clavipes TaxID=2585209 RepID=A0A8X6SBB1_TRICX|nr:integrase catalytic domain-containing protein [Trichonephila clavipes]